VASASGGKTVATAKPEVARKGAQKKKLNLRKPDSRNLSGENGFAEKLFNSAVALREAPVTPEPEDPVTDPENDRHAEEQIGKMTKGPHALECPGKECAGAFKNIGPGDHQQFHSVEFIWLKNVVSLC